MNPYQDTIFNEGYAAGGKSQVPPFVRKYVATIYQGDTTFATRFMDSLAFDAGENLPTGSIAYFDETTKKVKAGVGTATATNCPVPYIVYMGNDQKSVISQKGNAAGGLVSLLPCTGYFRVVTTVFDTTKNYVAGDFLTADKQTFDGLTNVGVATNGATAYSDVVIGIADGPEGVDHFDLPSLRFTCYFIPPVVGSN